MQLPTDDVREYLELVVRVHAEPGVGGDAVFVERAKGAEGFVPAALVSACHRVNKRRRGRKEDVRREGECVERLQPSVVDIAPFVRPAGNNHRAGGEHRCFWVYKSSHTSASSVVNRSWKADVKSGAFVKFWKLRYDEHSSPSYTNPRENISILSGKSLRT